MFLTAVQSKVESTNDRVLQSSTRKASLELTFSPELVPRPAENVEWMSKSTAFQKIVEDKLISCAESLQGRWLIAMADFCKGVPTESRLVESETNRAFHDTATPNAIKVPDGFIPAFAFLGKPRVPSQQESFRQFRKMT